MACHVTCRCCRDLYGAVGFPLRLSRTVVTGRKADVVGRFLNVLSYFVRCSEVHENRQGNGPFATDSDSEVASERLLEESSVDGDDECCEGPDRTKCDAGGCSVETDARTTEVACGGCVAAPSAGQDSSDVTLFPPEMKSSTVWYVDLPCEGATEGGTSNHGDGGDAVTRTDVCHMTTDRQGSGGKRDQIVRDQMSSVTDTTSTSHGGGVDSSTGRGSLAHPCVSVAGGSPTQTCSEPRASKNVCREQCAAVVTPSECHSSHEWTASGIASDHRTDTTQCGHCDKVECDRLTDQLIQTTGQHALPQPLFFFRRFDQSAIDETSGHTESQHSSPWRQKSNVSEPKCAGDLLSDTMSTETSVKVDTSCDTQVSISDVSDTRERCQLSPSFIREETKLVRVRLIGRMAPPEVSETSLQVAPVLHAFEAKSGNDRQAPDGAVMTQDDMGSTSDIGNSVGNQRCTDTSDSDSCLTESSDYLLQVDIPDVSQGSSPGMCLTRGKEGFQDSGMFEVSGGDAVTYGDVARTDARDSGFSTADFSESVEAEDSLVSSSHSGTTATSSGASTLCNDRQTPSRFTFSRSNSMFDEYFREDTADGATPLPVQSAVDEIPADVFNEYLDAPMPDASELRKFSVTSQTTSPNDAKPCYVRLPSMEESPSMFDEYFADESNKVSGTECDRQAHTREHSLEEKTARKCLDFDEKTQLETLTNDAAAERSDTGVTSSARRKHRSEELVPRKNSLQLVGRQISTPAPSMVTSRTRWVVIHSTF